MIIIIIQKSFINCNVACGNVNDTYVHTSRNMLMILLFIFIFASITIYIKLAKKNKNKTINKIFVEKEKVVKIKQTFFAVFFFFLLFLLGIKFDFMLKNLDIHTKHIFN